MSGVQYLNAEEIVAKRQTPAPRNRSATGYGPKMPTSWMLRMSDKRERRVYVSIYGNLGSAYILIKGERRYLGSYEP